MTVGEETEDEDEEGMGGGGGEATRVEWDGEGGGGEIISLRDDYVPPPKRRVCSLQERLRSV